jgi:spore coat polysaccharide biosynthesis predicted glycosyltransferase SpsG
MRYVLRADASQSIGAGHVMRSSAIAEELIAVGKEVIFVGRISDLSWVEERIASLGFSQVYSETSDFKSNPKSDVLVLDSYDIEVEDPFLAQQNWCHIIAIVDEMTPDYSCTLRVHPGLNSNWTGDSNAPILSGPKYIPIRSSLISDKKSVIEESHKFKIAVIAGGSDPYGLVNEIAKILANFSEEFIVYLFTNSIVDSNLDPRFRYIKMGNQFEELTNDADLILTTASTSSLEFLARELCVGIACVVDNQKQNYETLGALGVAAQFGIRYVDNKWELDKEKIHSLITSSELRGALLAKSKGLIDFDGARRIVDAITTL